MRKLVSHCVCESPTLTQYWNGVDQDGWKKQWPEFQLEQEEKSAHVSFSSKLQLY